MPEYTLNEIFDIVLVLRECHNNYRQTAVLYRNRFPHRRHPNHCTISKLYYELLKPGETHRWEKCIASDGQYFK
ncbi:hypothetical protein ALC57_11805 [Trachymyrmex cornetzi]|uniref:DUF4817 domain-containing protein n=1 Tax=Trachymyrmex cornetzi TaxID=471704 RepID=A0A151J1Y1_9HYME|nr:hypothetical protein ALC57_11805 [Trachymyrmex cornetzi]